jgi:phage shock protein PspC (stress-responsive transcriptional regulator)
VVIFVAKKLWDTETRKEIFTGEFNKESTKWTINIRNWFVWNVQINNEKGTAGGNIKINFPIKSALGMSAVCVLIAMFATKSGASFLVSIIFLSFAIYHFRIWFKSIQLLKRIQSFQITLYRTNDSRIIAGVCGALARRVHISVALIRLLFLLLFPLFIYVYVILWIILPTEKIKSAAMN